MVAPLTAFVAAPGVPSVDAVTEVTSLEQWQEQVVQSRTTSVVDFYANWCGPCKTVGPIFDKLAEEALGADGFFSDAGTSATPRLRFFRVNVETVPEAAEVATIRALPTFQVWSGGAVMAQSVGSDTDKLRRLIAAAPAAAVATATR